MDKKRIALVNQRYGLEVNGGAEYYTQLIAGILSEKYDIEVLTTTAVNYDTWENYYPAGVQKLNGIKIRRFSVNYKRNRIFFGKFNSLIHYIRFPFMESVWIDLQGPVSKDLISYIKKHKDDYDIFIFVTYMYYHTVRGLPIVADKSILIPTAHDEACIYFDIYKKIFTIPKAIIFLTEEEKEFCNRIFQNKNICSDVIGIGVNIPESFNGDDFKQKYNISSKYIIYTGRIDPVKGCGELFQYFIRYKDEWKNVDLKLVLLGKKVMDIPDRSDILYLGYVSEEEKFNGIYSSNALVLPSEFESLSISVLEAMAIGVPVLVNGKCDVLKGHCEKSQGGLYYNNYSDFVKCLNRMLDDKEKEYDELKNNAKNYINKYYTWQIFKEKFNNIIEKM